MQAKSTRNAQIILKQVKCMRQSVYNVDKVHHEIFSNIFSTRAFAKAFYSKSTAHESAENQMKIQSTA